MIRMNQMPRIRRWPRLLGWRIGLCLFTLALTGLLLADRPLSTAAASAPDDSFPYGFIDQKNDNYFLIQLTATEPDYGYFSVALPGIGLLTNTTPAQVAASDPAAVQVTYDGAAVLDAATGLDPLSAIFTRPSGQQATVTIQLTATLNPAQHTGTVTLTYNSQQYTVSAVPPAHTAEPVFAQIVAAFAQQDWAQMYGLLDRQWQASMTQAEFVTWLTADLPTFGTLTDVQVLAAPDYATAREGYTVATGLVALTFTTNGAATVEWDYITLVADGGQWKLNTFVPVPANTLAVTPGGPYTVVAGQSVALAATALNPAGGTLTYAWDLDGNGSFETAGQNATFAAAGLQAPASRTIGVRATNGAGQSATAQTTVTVTAAATALAFNGVNQDVEVPTAPTCTSAPI
jgi:hypothetical protein